MTAKTGSIWYFLLNAMKTCIPIGMIWGTAEVWNTFFFSTPYRFSVEHQFGQVFVYLLIAFIAGCGCGTLAGIMLWVTSLFLKSLHKLHIQRIFLMCLSVILYFYVLSWWHRDIHPLAGFLEPLGILATALITLSFVIGFSFLWIIIPKMIKPSIFSLKNIFLLILAILVITTGTGFYTGVKQTNYANNNNGKSVVFLSIDTLRGDHVGAYGNPRIKTPFMDLMVKKGIQFANCFSQIPGTNPSFASIMTSLYPHEHNVFYNGVSLNPKFITLPEILKSNGYLAGAFIAAAVLKSHVSGLKKGFHVYNETYSIRDHGIHPLRLFKFFRGFSVRIAEEVNNAVFPFLDSCINRKFFLWLHYYDPHNSYTPPYPYNEFYNPGYKGQIGGETRNANWFNDQKTHDPEDVKQLISLYDGEVSYVDACLEKVYVYIKKTFKSREKRFLYIITADHGENMGDHEMSFGHGPLLYNPSLRVPLIVVGPSIDSSVLVTENVETIDITPSILKWVNLGSKQKVSGRIIFPHQYPRKQNAVFAENGLRLVSMESRNWKCIYSMENSSAQLFDMVNDPYEKNDLAMENVKTVLTMRNKIQDFLGMYKNFNPLKPQLDPKTLKELQNLGYLK